MMKPTGSWEDIPITPKQVGVLPVSALYEDQSDYYNGHFKSLVKKALEQIYNSETLPPRKDCAHTRSVFKCGKWKCTDCYQVI